MLASRWIKVMVVVCMCSVMPACMTTKPLNASDPAQLRADLKRGDRVELVTRSGQQLKFVIESVDDDGLRGAGQSVAYGDIRSIDRTQIDMMRTGLIALGVVAAGALAAGGGGGGGGSGY
jgi:hypothetical protein